MHIVPPLTNDWVLSAECPCLDLELGFTLNLELESKTHPPWNATISSIYELGEVIGKNNQ